MYNNILSTIKSNNNSYKNSSDLETACREHMQIHDLPCDVKFMEFNNTYKRYSATGKKSLNEWYIGSYVDDGLIVTYGSWSKQVKYTFFSFSNEPYNYEKSQRRKKQIEEHNKLSAQIAAAVQAQVIKETQDIWSKASDDPLCPEHSLYINEKGIKPYGIKYGDYFGIPTLIIPLVNIYNEIRTLEYIFRNPDPNDSELFPKRFKTDAPKRGNFHIINNEKINDNDTIYVVEGYGTGASVYEAIKRDNVKVVCAMDAGNIKACVPLLKEKFECEIIIAGDNDEVGRNSAIEVAKEFGLQVTFPVIKREIGKDFNDVAKEFGIRVLMEQLKNTEKFEDPIESVKKIAEKLLAKEEPCASFVLDDIPPILKNLTESICNTNSTHPIAVLSSLLTTASSFINIRYYMQESEERDKGYFQALFPNLWIMCIAKSGKFKSTGLLKGSKLADERRNEIWREISEHRKMVASETNKQRVKQLLEELPEFEHRLSLRDVMLPNRLTPEALLDHLAREHRGGMFSNELGGWIKGLNRNTNADLMAIYTDLFDVPPIYRYKTKTSGDNVITRPFISICGVTTIDWINDSIKDKDINGGFYPRWLMFSLPPVKDRPPSLPTRKKEIVQNSYTEYSFILNNLDNHRIYVLSPAAIKYYDHVYDLIYTMSESLKDDTRNKLDPYVSRWCPYILKISIIMQVFLDPFTNIISQKAVKAAFSFVKPAIKSTLFLYNGQLGESEFERNCRRVFEFICNKSSKNGFAIHRDVSRSDAGKVFNSKDLADVLQKLIDSGKIVKTEHKNLTSCTYAPTEESL